MHKLIRLTDNLSGVAININPLHMSVVGTTTEDKATFIYVGANIFFVKETEQEVVDMVEEARTEFFLRSAT